MTQNAPVPNLPLAHASTPGLTIPQLGFGVWEIPEDTVETALATAFETGYRHIDTARIYGNEAGVGRAIAASGLPRDDLFITTKLWIDDHRRVGPAFDESMDRLGLETLDLYLIHWPAPKKGDFVRAFTDLLELQRSGRVTSVGVCNFTIANLERLQAETGVLPSINQVELSPYLQQRELRAFHAEHQIVTEDWSPLGVRAGLLDDPVIHTVAAKHEVTPAQVVLRWHVQIGSVVLTRSVTPERIIGNFDVFGFELDDEDLAAIDGLDRGARTGLDPETFG